MKLDPACARLWTRGYEQFLSIAGWLQVGMGDRNILLPVHKLASLLEVDPRTIGRYRQWAIVDGFLVEVAEAQHDSGRATEYRFNVARCRMLEEAAQQGTQESYHAANQKGQE
jgi:hypothetical protein